MGLSSGAQEASGVWRKSQVSVCLVQNHDPLVLSFLTGSICFGGFPNSSIGKESPCNAGDSGLGRFPGEGIGYPLQYSWASLVAQLVKNPPAMWETWVQSLGWEDPHGKRRGKRSREKLPTPVFWPREFHRLCRLLWSEHQSQGLRCNKVHGSS